MYYSIFDEQLKEFRNDYMNYENKQELKSDFEYHMREILCDGTEENTESMKDDELWYLFDFRIIDHEMQLNEDLFEYYKISNDKVKCWLNENDKVYKVSDRMYSDTLRDISDVIDYFLTHAKRHFNKNEFNKLKKDVMSITDVTKLNNFQNTTGLTFEEVF